jgi:hypothetical protein
MATFNAQQVIDILQELSSGNQVDREKFDEAIDALERIKSTINMEDEQAIDKVDEIQDYLQYLLTVREPVIAEIKEELTYMINDLQA